MAEPSETCVAWGLDGGVHEARNLKPMLTPEEQVELLKAKGVTFECCDERAAIEALTRKNTFMHLAACRRLFHKHREGPKKGKYIKLDFADLLRMDNLEHRDSPCFPARYSRRRAFGKDSRYCSRI